MSLLLLAPERDMQPYKRALLDVDPNLDVEIWPEVNDEARVQFAVLWNHPAHVLEQYLNLKAISSLGAGVDHILTDKTIPADIPVCRIISGSLEQQMKAYILNAVLNYQRNTYAYFRQQQQGVWKAHAHPSAKKISIGVMGLGALGQPVAQMLADWGYTVAGWANSKKELANVDTFAGADQLHPFLNKTEILICLLPLTESTSGILDLDVFKHMQHPGYVINVARGQHLVEEDLIYALDKEWLTGACLDVFTEEPLPDKHPFWNRTNIIITPHVSSITKPVEVAEQIVENYKRALSGMKLQHRVDRQRGY